ncbi:hypothetical protein CDIK_0306 [Cucumispora dikerogammari]|nr:hypothetical protein CDIK_0306 [Cucumispora dikerogammari]
MADFFLSFLIIFCGQINVAMEERSTVHYNNVSLNIIGETLSFQCNSKHINLGCKIKLETDSICELEETSLKTSILKQKKKPPSKKQDTTENNQDNWVEVNPNLYENIFTIQTHITFFRVSEKLLDILLCVQLQFPGLNNQFEAENLKDLITRFREVFQIDKDISTNHVFMFRIVILAKECSTGTIVRLSIDSRDFCFKIEEGDANNIKAIFI